MDWVPGTVGSTMARNAAARPDALAFVFGGGDRVTWRELDSWSDRLAKGFLAHGIGRGQHVAIFMANSPQWMAAFYALAKLGAVVVPVNIRYKAEECGYVLKQSDAVLLIARTAHGDRDYTDMLGQALAEVSHIPAILLGDHPANLEGRSSSWADLEHLGEQVPDQRLAEAKAAVDPDDFLLIQYTSGTTGFSKGALLRQNAMLRNANALGVRIRMTDQDRHFSGMPFFHVGGTSGSMLMTLTRGATLCFLDHFKGDEALDLIERERCTSICGLDTMLLDVIAQPRFPTADISYVRRGWTVRNERVFATFPGIGVVYALSECSPTVTMSHGDDPIEVRRDTCGKPLDGVEVRIAHPETYAELPMGETGLILVRGWNVMAGYYKQPEANAKVFRPGGWFDTGDLGRLLPSGHLCYEGRFKDLVRVGGENVSAIEIETVINNHSAVLMSAIVAVPDPRLSEVPCAFIQLNGTGSPTAEEMIALCELQLASYKVPRYVYFVTHFEMTPSGKVIKPPLRKQAASMLGLDK